MSFDWGNAVKGFSATGGSPVGLAGGFFGNDNDYEKDTNKNIKQKSLVNYGNT